MLKNKLNLSLLFIIVLVTLGALFIFISSVPLFELHNSIDYKSEVFKAVIPEENNKAEIAKEEAGFVEGKYLKDDTQIVFVATKVNGKWKEVASAPLPPQGKPPKETCDPLIAQKVPTSFLLSQLCEQQVQLDEKVFGSLRDSVDKKYGITDANTKINVDYVTPQFAEGSMGNGVVIPWLAIKDKNNTWNIVTTLVSGDKNKKDTLCSLPEITQLPDFFMTKKQCEK